eukprot:TRINITY_DN2788_c0_g2_i2.p1 TRINITY_DN2788_c0_g2~~TRINITY_DN2788_c0_g2_i2.p1  ORF type:complete len:626 (+),score=75.62 TRINITY_DN2788_c0_g2_i2:59-1936(+)
MFSRNSKQAATPNSTAANKETSQPFKIGSYVLGKTLGKGSFGKVKLATHEVTGHKVAVKILNRHKIKSSQMDKKIKREITVLKLFRHPNIIRLYDVMETTTDIFMCMEYVDKGELYDYIVKHGVLSQSAARRFFQQIISGVEYCHHYQVAHRDLKPENLLLDSKLNVKIADFGLSNLMKDGDFLKTSCGSPNYAAPEVISGMLYAGPEIDVWSCGVILYALLCGRLPFDEESIPALFQKIKSGRFYLPPSIPQGPRDIIKKVLLVDPMRRMTLSQIRETEWFQTDLPAHLSLSPAQLAEKSQSDDIDMEIVKQVCIKLDITQDVVINVVENGDDPSVADYDVSLAYNILLDTKKRKELEILAEVGTDEPPSSPNGTVEAAPSASTGTSTPAMNSLTSSPVIDILTQLSAIHTKTRYNKSKFVVPSSLPSSVSLSKTPMSSSPPFKSYIQRSLGGAIHSAAKSAPGFMGSPTEAEPYSAQNGGDDSMIFPLDDATVGSASGGTLPPQESSSQDNTDSLDGAGFLAYHGCGWRLGLMSEKKSADVLTAIYDILVEKQLVWKVISPYHLSVRGIKHKPGDFKIGIRLYRMHDRHDKGFLIDLTRIDGNTLPTMDIISELYDLFQVRVV